MSDDNKQNSTPREPDDQDHGEPPRTHLGRQLFLWILVIAGVLFALMLIKQNGDGGAKNVSFSVLIKHIEQKDVKSLIAKGEQVTATLKRDAAPSYSKIKATVPSSYMDSETLNKWNELVPSVDHEVNDGMWPAILINVLPLLLLVGIMFYFFNRQMRMVNSRDGGFPFLKNDASLAHKERPDVSFDDVAGVEEAKAELKETIQFLKTPERFRTVGGRVPRGLLLVGHPGTGKTLMAKAVAGEAKVPFFSLCGSDFVELFVGVGASRVRNLFKHAREQQPCIIFLDEIDAVGRKRGTGLGGGHDEREQTLNAILSEMDGFEREDGIIVMAATNRPDVLDPALLRPGRFDRQIVVDLPDLKGREEILEIHLRDIKVADNLDLDVIARGTPGFSGADLEALVNESAILAASRHKKAVTLSELEEARDKVRFGRQKKSRVMCEEDRKMTAYHEAGHTLVASLHPDVEPLHKVTIIPRGLSLGMTMILPEKDKYGMRKRECIGTLVMNLAGRVAESMFCNDISSGAKDDIDNATKLARKMVTQWGMSEKLGPVSYSDDEEHVFLGSEITRSRKHGEHIAEEIDEEIHGMLTDAYSEATKMCEEHSDELEQLAEALLKLETLNSDEVEAVIEGKTAEELAAEKQTEEESANAEDTGPKGEEQKGQEEKGEEGTASGDLPAPAGSPA
ncbi:MAG: ATP-dependent zinc metalloprotease FtsH [Planctomycetes bacterium]|nr:ATP-dependent zinc metalloprotease FtsH [Planctomycetota bacterium]